MNRFTVGTLAAGILAATVAGSPCMSAIDSDSERQAVEQWRAARLADLLGEQGWVNIVGLFWLEPGENTFGRAAKNRIVLDHPALAERAGSFHLEAGKVRFTARSGAGITQDGHEVSTIEMVSDAAGSPTTLSSGSLRFFVIERSGKLGVRARDLDSPRLHAFKPIDYFPIDTGWAFSARFEPYTPAHHIRIVNILGLEEDKESPGALVFNKDGQEWRLDAVLENAGDQTLFVMFADGTTGKETYGAGRYLHVPRPPSSSATVELPVDFNEAYNPPCAFNDFATCPLPPYQNRLSLRIVAGEKAYARAHASAAH